MPTPASGDPTPASGDGDRRDADPLIRIVRGTPAPAELAALVGVLVARARPAGVDTTGVPGPPWVRLSRPGAVGASRLPARPGAAAWRLSALPR